MIVAERKPFEQILELLAGRRRVLVLGCGGCVSVCLTGGERQAQMLASQLRLAAAQKGATLEVEVDCITRQCDKEFLANLKHDPATFDAVLSLACGVGVGFMSEQYPATAILPALNTTFYGASQGTGQWAEFCHGCGDCVLGWTGGICPIARCSKSLINGACGGTKDGKCEVNKDMDCAWHLIYERLKAMGRLEELAKLRAPRSWSKDRGRGQRRLVLAEMQDQEQTNE